MSNEDIIRAFHLMWDNFPEAVTITQKSREIVAVNKKAAEFGLQPGVKCSTIGKPENHRSCKCNEAVDTGEAQFCTYEGNFGKAYGYWIPIPEKPEWVIHFGVGYAFEYPKIDRSPSVKAPASVYNLAKGTDLEAAIATLAQGEANGVMMYYALARLANEQGLPEAAKTFIASANQEAVHAGFYATLNGKYPQDFWELLDRVRAAEYAGEGSVKALADKFRAAGLDKAADEMETFAAQEKHHGVVIDELFKKYKPDFKPADTAGQKVYVCPCCGYRYVGDLDAEPDNWTCPVCAQPKKDFKQVDAQVAEAQPVEAQPAKKVWVCTICGYEHTGDNPPEICPLCGQPATAFKEKTS